MNLERLDPLARDTLRRVLIHDQADRDAIASQLLRYRDGHGDDWADIIDMPTMHPEARRRLARLPVSIASSVDPPVVHVLGPAFRALGADDVGVPRV